MIDGDFRINQILEELKNLEDSIDFCIRLLSRTKVKNKELKQKLLVSLENINDCIKENLEGI